MDKTKNIKDKPKLHIIYTEDGLNINPKDIISNSFAYFVKEKIRDS